MRSILLIVENKLQYFLHRLHVISLTIRSARCNGVGCCVVLACTQNSDLEQPNGRLKHEQILTCHRRCCPCVRDVLKSSTRSGHTTSPSLPSAVSCLKDALWSGAWLLFHLPSASSSSRLLFISFLLFPQLPFSSSIRNIWPVQLRALVAYTSIHFSKFQFI